MEKNLAASVADFPGANVRRNSILDRPLGDGFDLEEHLNGIHRAYLQRTMENAHGVKVQAAKLLGNGSYQTLDVQLKRLEGCD